MDLFYISTEQLNLFFGGGSSEGVSPATVPTTVPTASISGINFEVPSRKPIKGIIVKKNCGWTDILHENLELVVFKYSGEMYLSKKTFKDAHTLYNRLWSGWNLRFLEINTDLELAVELVRELEHDFKVNMTIRKYRLPNEKEIKPAIPLIWCILHIKDRPGGDLKTSLEESLKEWLLTEFKGLKSIENLIFDGGHEYSSVETLKDGKVLSMEIFRRGIKIGDFLG